MHSQAEPGNVKLREIRFPYFLGNVILGYPSLKRRIPTSDCDQLILIITHVQGLHVFKLVRPASGLNAFHNVASLRFRQSVHQIDRSLVYGQNIR